MKQKNKKKSNGIKLFLCDVHLATSGSIYSNVLHKAQIRSNAHCITVVVEGRLQLQIVYAEVKIIIPTYGLIL